MPIFVSGLRKQHHRVTFEDMKPYRVYINEFDGFKMESAAFIK